jgi:predicted flap endonuclease-1-like 5' DNA nuclease
VKRYSIKPARISLEHFKWLTGEKRILPARMMLQEQMDSRFSVLKESGISNLEELLRILGSKPKIENFSVQTGLPIDYLVLLKREAGSYLAKPFPLSRFPGIPFEYTELLKSKGISTTKKFFEQFQSKDKQEELATSTGIPDYRLKELYSLCDLSRITGIGAVFARVVYEAGIRSVEEFSQTDASEQILKYKAVIEKYGYAAGDIGEKDITYCIAYAQELVKKDTE